MDISKVTVKELLANQKACDAMNAIDPKILKSPMVKLVKGKTVEAVFNMVPDSKVSPRSSRRSGRPSPPYKPGKQQPPRSRRFRAGFYTRSRVYLLL